MHKMVHVHVCSLRGHVNCVHIVHMYRMCGIKEAVCSIFECVFQNVCT
jgi:hypothetical protein